MQKNRIIYTLLVVAIVIAIFAIKEADVPDANNIQTASHEIYYLEKESGKLSFEMKNISGETEQEILNNILTEMRIPPKNEALSLAIPESLDVSEISLEEETVKINIENGYKSLKTGEEMICRAAFVWTFTGLDFVENVEIFVNGETLAKANGEPFGPMGRGDLIVDADIDAEPTNAARILRLYFSNEYATELTVEERRVEVNPNQPLEKYVLEQLIVGPMEEGNIPTVPTETKIRDVKTADGICYVDLSQDFVAKHSGGSTGEMLTVYSIVNSLCELDDVEKVQFLIEGEKQIEFKGHIAFDKPFKPIIEGLVSEEE